MLAFRVSAHPDVRRFALEVRQVLERVEEILVRLRRANPVRPPVLLEREADERRVQAHSTAWRCGRDCDVDGRGYGHAQSEGACCARRAGEDHGRVEASFEARWGRWGACCPGRDFIDFCGEHVVIATIRADSLSRSGSYFACPGMMHGTLWSSFSANLCASGLVRC